MASEPRRIEVKHINPYLVDAPDILLYGRSKPLCDGVPEMRVGNSPIDGGNFLFTKADKEAFLAKEPTAAKYMRPWVGSEEFINGIERYCLWLGDASPAELRAMPEVMKRVEAVRRTRLQSTSLATRRAADTPTRFFFENIPKAAFIIIPEVSSGTTEGTVPIGFLSPDHLASKKVMVVQNATMFHFGVLTSAIHMGWMRLRRRTNEERLLLFASDSVQQLPLAEGLEASTGRGGRAMRPAAA